MIRFRVCSHPCLYERVHSALKIHSLAKSPSIIIPRLGSRRHFFSSRSRYCYYYYYRSSLRFHRHTGWIANSLRGDEDPSEILSLPLSPRHKKLSNSHNRISVYRLSRNVIAVENSRSCFGAGYTIRLQITKRAHFLSLLIYLRLLLSVLAFSRGFFLFYFRGYIEPVG